MKKCAWLVVLQLAKKRRVVSGVYNTNILSLLSRLYIYKLKERKEEVDVQHINKLLIKNQHGSYEGYLCINCFNRLITFYNKEKCITNKITKILDSLPTRPTINEEPCN